MAPQKFVIFHLLNTLSLHLLVPSRHIARSRLTFFFCFSAFQNYIFPWHKFLSFPITLFIKQHKKIWIKMFGNQTYMVPEGRLELPTKGLWVLCSTSELLWQTWLSINNNHLRCQGFVKQEYCQYIIGYLFLVQCIVELRFATIGTVFYDLVFFTREFHLYNSRFTTFII